MLVLFPFRFDPLLGGLEMDLRLRDRLVKEFQACIASPLPSVHEMIVSKTGYNREPVPNRQGNSSPSSDSLPYVLQLLR